MKRALRMLALLLAVVSALGWFSLGANRGWTHTSVPVTTVDEVTGLEGIQYRRQFVPGLEFLGGALLAAAFLAGASPLFPNQQIKQNTP